MNLNSSEKAQIYVIGSRSQDQAKARRNRCYLLCLGAVVIISLSIWYSNVHKKDKVAGLVYNPYNLQETNYMEQVFGEKPDFDSIGTKPKNGLTFESALWDNPYIGGSIFNDSMLYVNDTLTPVPNAFKQNLSDAFNNSIYHDPTSGSGGYFGYFEFKKLANNNTPSDFHYVDVQLFAYGLDSETYNRMQNMNGSASYMQPFDNYYEDLKGYARSIDYYDTSSEGNLADISQIQPYRMKEIYIHPGGDGDDPAQFGRVCNLDTRLLDDLSMKCSVGFYNKRTGSDHDYVPKLMGKGARVDLRYGNQVSDVGLWRMNILQESKNFTSLEYNHLTSVMTRVSSAILAMTAILAFI